VCCICVATCATDMRFAEAEIITCTTGRPAGKRSIARGHAIYSLHTTSSLLQESPQMNYRFRRIVGLEGAAYSQPMNVALNFPTFRAGAGAK
jgi:hypothetical protein